MSQAIVLRWLSARTLQAVQQAVHEATTSWARAWGVDEPGLPSAQAAAQWPPVAADGAGLNLAVDNAPPDSWTRALTRALFQSDVHGSATAATVAADATSQLRTALRRALGLVGGEAVGEAAVATPGHIGALLQLDILGSTWWAQVPHAALSRAGLLQAPKPSPVPRWNAEQTLATTPVPVQAVLGLVQVDVLDVLNLAHGDVLLLPRKGLDAAVQVQGIGTPLQLPARLGTTDHHRAVQWLSTAHSAH